jgi:predicted permease
MAALREWLLRLWGTLRRNPCDREMEEELRSHLEIAADEIRQRGGSPEDALREARLRFGGSAQAMEAMRDRRGFPWLDDLARDARYALRALRRNPIFAVVSVLTLAVAIGANTAMFSVVNAVLLRPLPYPSPEQLAMVWTGTPGQNGRPSFATVEEWRRYSRGFADMAILDPVTATLTDSNGAERIRVARISPNFFPLLGVQPLLGRGFTSEEAGERRRLALISHRFWQTRFAGSRDAIGASIVLDGIPSQIIGILADGAAIPGLGLDRDVWEPHTMFPDWETRRSARAAGSWFVIGRLRPDVTVDQGQAEMSEIARALDDETGVSVVPLSMYVVGPGPRLALWMLTGAVFCVLLIAAANVASLSLARRVRRAREMAIRAAIGASRRRIVRQLLTESATLAVMSGLLGTLLALAGVRLIRTFGPAGLPRLNEAGLDFRLLGWAMAISLFTGILVGLAPAITVRTRRIHRGLVAAEFALAIILLAGAGLLVRSWISVNRVDVGFRPERVLSMQLSTTAFETPPQRASFYAGVLEQVESLPGVESAALVGDLFVSSDAERLVTLEENAGASERLRLRVDEASERFFTTVGTPLLQGRFFSAEDGPDSPPVAIINEAMARRLWPGLDPAGRRFRFGPRDSEGPWVTVVGVVGDMRRQGLEIEAVAQMFEPLAQNPSRLATLLARTSAADPLTMAGSVRAAVHRVDKQAPVYGITTLEDQLGAYLTQRRFQTSLVTAFSVVALLLAAIGIYGLIHYSVAARTREIGVRMAIGARPADIFRIIIREGLQLSLTGLLPGLAGALLVGQAGASLLFGVAAADPLTFIAVSLLLAAVAAAACYFPARRAMKVEPTAALRHE